MTNNQDYLQDLANIRSMMERSSKFLSLSGWAGVLAGCYALAGAYVACVFFSFNPDGIIYPINEPETIVIGIPAVIVLALIVLILAIGTAVALSTRKARNLGESIWNPTSKRMIIHMAYPLVGGGILILVLITEGFAGLAAPLTLLFYGLALVNASVFTYKEIRSFGLVLIVLGLLSGYMVEYSIWLWAIGFGFLHIVYGIYLHIKYEQE